MEQNSVTLAPSWHTKSRLWLLVASKAVFLKNYLAVSTWILNGSSIECLEKKYQPFSLAGVRFGSLVDQISGLKSAWRRSRLCLTLLLCNVPVTSKLQHPPPPTLPGHLTSSLALEGGNLITTHRGWGIWLLAWMSCYKINHSRDVKLWWIQRKRLRICGRLVENQWPTQAVFRIWRCLKQVCLSYIYSM